MLYLHHSNRLETLAHQFAQLQTNHPLPPFSEETVVVQNIGMGRWLSLQLAHKNGIAAHLRYLFPAELTWEMLRSVLGTDNVPPRDEGAAPSLRWRLFKHFMENTTRWDALNTYLQTGVDGCWQLANQLSQVFDAYLFFRSEWIQTWEENQGIDAQVGWQAELWWEVVGQPKLKHWVGLQNAFVAQLSHCDKTKLPARVSFFSVPMLSRGYIRLLSEIAQHIDIHIFLMNPCAEYWGDIQSEKFKAKQHPDNPTQSDYEDLINVGNPLLASLGRQGRDFLDLIIGECSELIEQDYFETPSNPTLLEQIQSDILTLEMPSAFEMHADDDSIRIHSCHSPMREVEVLYDNLLALFSENPSLTPADVVVMTPNIDVYAPYIDAVFSTALHKLPYSVADSQVKHTQSILNLVNQILELPLSRCDAESIMALFEFVEVRDHLGLDETQVLSCRDWIRDVNICWGVDVETRIKLGGAPTKEHTWQDGLDRLLLGYALNGDDVFHDILPYPFIEGSQAHTLGEFMHVLNVVLDMQHWATQSHTIMQWREKITHVLFTLVGNTALLKPVWTALNAINTTLEQTEFDQPLAWSVLSDVLKEHLTQSSQSDGFLGRGITFCALLPMRTVPFRFVGLIGMNAKDFPRHDTYVSFNKMAKRRRGDRVKRNEDRYLFLESILSARDWLYMSYIGQNIVDNSISPPSVVVAEIIDYATRCDATFPKKHIIKHRLQAFSRYYLQAIPPYFTYSQHFTTQRTTQPVGQNYLPFWDKQQPLAPFAPETPYHLAMDELIRFYQNPIATFLEKRLQLTFTRSDYNLPTREPFELKEFADADIRKKIDRALQPPNPKSDDEILTLLRAQGLLPHGKLGTLLFEEQLQHVKSFRSQYPLPTTPFEKHTIKVNLDGGILYGTINKMQINVRVVHQFSDLNYSTETRYWIEHLVLNTQKPISTELHFMHKDNGLQCKKITLQPQPDALQQLNTLIQWYWQGMSEPLHYFPKSAQAYATTNTQEKKLSQALSKWFSSNKYTGECEKPVYQLFYRGVENPLKTHESLLAQIAEAFFEKLHAAKDG